MIEYFDFQVVDDCSRHFLDGREPKQEFINRRMGIFGTNLQQVVRLMVVVVVN